MTSIRGVGAPDDQSFNVFSNPMAKDQSLVMVSLRDRTANGL